MKFLSQSFNCISEENSKSRKLKYNKNEVNKKDKVENDSHESLEAKVETNDDMVDKQEAQNKDQDVSNYNQCVPGLLLEPHEANRAEYNAVVDQSAHLAI